MKVELKKLLKAGIPQDQAVEIAAIANGELPGDVITNDTTLKAAGTTAMKCPECGMMNKKGATKCSKCGESLTEKEPMEKNVRTKAKFGGKRGFGAWTRSMRESAAKKGWLKRARKAGKVAKKVGENFAKGQRANVSYQAIRHSGKIAKGGLKAIATNAKFAARVAKGGARAYGSFVTGGAAGRAVASRVKKAYSGKESLMLTEKAGFGRRGGRRGFALWTPQMRSQAAKKGWMGRARSSKAQPRDGVKRFAGGVGNAVRGIGKAAIYGVSGYLAASW